ncbi:MAG: hypothetical protein GXP26_12275 [Planctomycetes bacterium]|nr:hypothetical protein [Planctomycetota bacterium]
MPPSVSPNRKHFLSLAKVLLALLTASSAAANEKLGLQVPPGFEVTLFADDDLASDIYSMTFDSFGRVVVSGRGYVRILIDSDNDGVADTAKQFADGPQSGAQGMAFAGRDLLCTGDQGLLLYVDHNGDDRADGPAEVLLEAKAGGEHHLHAIRQGPDGWWYLMAGNMADITSKYATLISSPVKKPLAGTLLRLAPNFAKSEIIAHGFRNAYDFDFHSLGDIFTYDSDGERDISLPWYRPTRVFHVLPGSHAGWFSRHWKRPDYFFDMPPVVASFGRGSPTGVVCYRHTQFPEKYRNALFVLDWTYGRVMTLPLSSNGSIWQSQPEKFVTAVGQHGFAPTDAAVAPDGSLYISVGGRGTRGGVYRIRWKSAEVNTGRPDELTRCLIAPQPLSSWSRHQWEPIAHRVGEKALFSAAVDPRRSIPERIRAVEILTEKFTGLDTKTAQQLSTSKSAELRARVAWSLGRSPVKPHTQPLLDHFLRDKEPFTVRQALETLVGQPYLVIALQTEALSKLLEHTDPFIQQTLARVIASSRKPIQTPENSTERTRILRVSFRSRNFSSGGLFEALKVLGRDHPAPLRRDGVRAAQIALGDIGPGIRVVANSPVFEGYTCQIAPRENNRLIATLSDVLADIYPADEEPLNHELSRLIAMLAPDNPKLFASVLSQITDTSDPVEDIHHLIIVARLPVERTAEQRTHIANALVSLETKIEAAGLPRDTNWDDRISEMVAAQVRLDPLLPTAILQQPQLGEPGHTPLVQSLEGDQLEQAVGKFIDHIRANSDYRWASDVVQLLGRSKRKEVKSLLRAQVDDFSVRTSILAILAASPEPQDRPLFVEGLENNDVGILSQMARALESLTPSNNPAEQVTLIRTLRRLSLTLEERTIQDSVVRLLRANTEQSFGYKMGRPPSDRQTLMISAWSTWAEREYPTEWAQQTGSTQQDAEQLEKLLATVDWDNGNAARGEILFHRRSCAQCHSSRNSLGPDLAGVAARFSRRDLFTAIANPNRDVSPRYQTTLIATDDGLLHTGRVIYSSVDGLVFRTSTNQTLRINANEITTQRHLNTSLMPAGLLNDLKSNDLSDLNAYLRTLVGKSR